MNNFELQKNKAFQINASVMAKKLLLEYDDENPYRFIGISSNVREYQMVFHLVKKLNLQFKNVEAFKFTKGGHEFVYSLYLYIDHDNLINYYLISNKSNAHRLNAEFKNIDFFIILEGEIDDDFVADLAKKVKTLPEVIFTTVIDTEKFNEIQGLRYEFDMHLEKVLREI
jgi:hypothetical protein